MSDNGRDAKSGRFVTGNVGGPGRKPGSRNKLEEVFLRTLHDDFTRHGATAIEKMRLNDPVSYVRAIATLLPNKSETDVNVRHDMRRLTDEELQQIIDEGLRERRGGQRDPDPEEGPPTLN